jgi:hypothetical protein
MNKSLATFKLLLSGRKGQVSIFFSTTVVVMITFIAFIINIGMFVKAKINLQNATDAAAYAGASVQARQLTNISYMNWEMRNVYKEWMFKYYVLGGLNLESVANGNVGDEMKFTMQSYTRSASAAVDKYNFPSICIDFANTGGLGMCTRYLVPGLPRFENSNVLGMDEATNAFVDEIVSQKSIDCSDRTALNFYTANTWAYNVITNDASVNNFTSQAPQVAANFMGAFPQAFELGLRIRSLEAQVNHPPQGNICSNPSSGVNCNVPASGLNTPSKERALKAFTSGYRNLGSHGSDNYFKNSFTLTEVPPTLDTSINVEGSLSTILIPNGPGRNKHYVDLKLMTLNYATFYTAFAVTQGGINVGGGGVISAEGQCNATKIGLPVPGYPLGFVKNPDYLTYYAVEGKAKFIGLFNPFSTSPEIVLKAYSAAKPFGGRIGPMLFDLSDSQKIKSRANGKSSPYITALDTNSFQGTFGAAASGNYQPGMPVPINIGTGKDKFWITSEADNVGGWIDGQNVFYGIPNMVYDYPTGKIENNSIYQAGNDIQIIARTGVGSTPKAGLYNRPMFERLRSKLKSTGGTSSQDITDALLMVKSPTIYDANNYLIPTPEILNDELKTDSWGAVTGNQTGTVQDQGKSYRVFDIELYAPIISSDPDALFKSPGELDAILSNYILRQEDAILKYRNSMNLVAADIFNNNSSGSTAQNTGREAAAALSDLTVGQYQAIGSAISVASDPATAPSCASIAGRFVHFYTGNTGLVNPANPTKCVTPLVELMKTRWADASLIGEVYRGKYSLPEGMSDQLFTGYRPGSDHDAGNVDGVQINALNGNSDKMIRNSYSTKFIPLKSVSNSSSAAFGNGGRMIIYSEGLPNSISPEALRSNFKNPIDSSALSIDINSAKH